MTFTLELGGALLLGIGIRLMALAGVAAVIAIIVFTVGGKKLKKTLEAEYGKKRR